LRRRLIAKALDGAGACNHSDGPHNTSRRGEGVVDVWHVEQSVETAARPETVWRCWTDVNGWPRWVSDFQWSRLVGPVEGGRTIENKAKGLPVAKVRIVSVRPLSFFRTESRLLGLHLVFDHWIEPTPKATRIKTRMNFGGPLAPILWLVRR